MTILTRFSDNRNDVPAEKWENERSFAVEIDCNGNTNQAQSWAKPEVERTRETSGSALAESDPKVWRVRSTLGLGGA
jgi:hypothetical protein